MNPLHEGTDVENIGKEKEQISSADLNPTRMPIDEDIHLDTNNGYSTVATTSHGHGHGDHTPTAPSRLPESVQNFLEHIFKLKKRGTTFEVISLQLASRQLLILLKRSTFFQRDLRNLTDLG